MTALGLLQNQSPIFVLIGMCDSAEHFIQNRSTLLAWRRSPSGSDGKLGICPPPVSPAWPSVRSALLEAGAGRPRVPNVEAPVEWHFRYSSVPSLTGMSAIHATRGVELVAYGPSAQGRVLPIALQQLSARSCRSPSSTDEQSSDGSTTDNEPSLPNERRRGVGHYSGHAQIRGLA